MVFHVKFQGLPKLVKLDLSYNEFLVVPKETENAPNLLELNLDGNLMQHFARNSFIGMHSLQILSASNMRYLTSIQVWILDGGMKRRKKASTTFQLNFQPTSNLEKTVKKIIAITFLLTFT